MTHKTPKKSVRVGKLPDGNYLVTHKGVITIVDRARLQHQEISYLEGVLRSQRVQFKIEEEEQSRKAYSYSNLDCVKIKCLDEIKKAR